MTDQVILAFSAVAAASPAVVKDQKERTSIKPAISRLPTEGRLWNAITAVAPEMSAETIRAKMYQLNCNTGAILYRKNPFWNCSCQL